MSLDKIEPGQSAKLQATVTAEMSINRTGREGDDVLSTPSLLQLMEQCSIEASDPHLPEGFTTVGYAVDGMRHLAPTPIGQKVTVTSTLTEVNGNRLTYSIQAFEGNKKIGTAIHKRAIIPIK